jgi:hypothetical protein
MSDRWLTLPERGDFREPALRALVMQYRSNYEEAWNLVQEPEWLMEIAVVSGMPTERILMTAAQSCTEAWAHWTAGATDTRPPQVITGVSRWLRRQAGFEEIWSTWEMAEGLQQEVKAWYQTQQGAVIANAILNVVGSVHSLATAARDVATPEPGHEDHNPERYEKKNAAAENAGLLDQAIQVITQNEQAGSWYHSHAEPSATDDEHDTYAKQVLGFTIRQHLSGPEVAQRLKSRFG